MNTLIVIGQEGVRKGYLNTPELECWDRYYNSYDYEPGAWDDLPFKKFIATFKEKNLFHVHQFEDELDMERLG